MKSTSSRRIPPGPRFNPLSLILRGPPPDTLALFMNIAREYGDVALMRAGPWSMYLATHPRDVQHILQDNHKNYSKADRINAVLKPVLGEGLLTSDGNLWRQQRRLMQPSFNAHRLAAIDTVVTDATKAMLERWRRQPDLQPLEIVSEMRSLSFGILGKTLFGTDVVYTGDTDQAATIFFEYFDYASRHLVRIPDFIPTRRNRRFRAALRKMDRIVDDLIQQRRRNGTYNGDLLSTLLLAEEQQTTGREKDRQLRDEVATLIRVGYETPAVAMAWTWYFLSRYPEVERKLRQEVAEVLNGRTPSFHDITQLKYTRAVIEESMRLCPPVWAVSRCAINDDQIGGYDLPANSVVILCPYITHRHPDVWKNPDMFEPERFMPGHSDSLPRGAFVPFGGGPRRCIGDEFAMIEALLIIPMVVQNYHLDLVPGHPVEPAPIFTLRPRHGLLMTLRQGNCSGGL